MLTVRESLPEGLLGLEAWQLGAALPGPTLFHLPGRKTPPLFVSLLLHGDERAGWNAMRALLASYTGRELPRTLSFLIGNVAAAGERKRYLPWQPDYNRIWTVSGGAAGASEQAMARRVVDEMSERGVFASIDIHTSTGLNPHYACVREIDNASLNLALLFGRTVVWAQKPDGVQMEAFSRLCPAVTLECGPKGLTRGADHALEFIEACLNMSAISGRAVHEHDLDLFHALATVKIREDAALGAEAGKADLVLRPDIDRLNFRELEPGTPLGRTERAVADILCCYDEKGCDVGREFFSVEKGALVTARPFMPSMFTADVEAVRMDCLGYLMEKIDYPTLCKIQHRGYSGGGTFRPLPCSDRPSWDR